MTSTRDPFVGTSEMARRMRALDWSETSLGDVATWPQSLRSALGICVESRFPIAIYWGSDLTLLYNDAWSPIPGAKHPWALGRPAVDVWPEIWADIGPMFAQVFSTGDATYLEDALLLMRRHGYTEECYFNYTFTPIRGELGSVEGVFNAVIETTFRVIAERRTALLRDLGERLAGLNSISEVCATAASLIVRDGLDATFCLIYLIDEKGHSARRAAVAGISEASPAAPDLIQSGDAGGSVWPLDELLESARTIVVDRLAEKVGALPGGAWPDPATEAIVVPLTTGASERPSGFLVVGASPRRAVDDEYRQFAVRAASHISAALTTVTAYELERTRAEALAQLDRAKTLFFSNVSHEFRTPLTLMLGPIEEALTTPARALTGADLEATHRNAMRLLKLVNTLLDFARIESGRAEPTFQSVDLSALTRDYASAFRAAIERAGLRFTVDCPALATRVDVDPAMWEKIVLNLLSNALKFTFDGEISITLRDAARGVELTVSDTGVGIPHDELPRLFERFHRVEGARARTHEGSGIGLALVHDLVQLHRGDVRVESTLGTGTRFTVALPPATEDPRAERVPGVTADASLTPSAPAFVAEAMRWVGEQVDRTPADGRPSPRLPRHVLIADDNADLRDYITRLLHDVCEVTPVSDGEQALAALKGGTFDLLVTDVMMPTMDGFELVRQIRLDPSLRSTQIIMLSARAGEESRIDGLEHGADDYIVKPFAAREFVAKVASRLGLAEARQRIEEQAAALTRAHEAAEAANSAKDEFLAMLGHELRNPLAPIATAVQLMRLRGAEFRELAVIERQVGHLTRLVDDLLDISRITRGKVILNRQPIELSEIVARAVEIASPLLEQRRHVLTVHVPPRGLVVDGDSARLAQVVANLLTNAAKYSDPESRILVSAHGGDGRVELRVKDAGIGIPAELLDTVFDAFVQERQAIDRARGGLGLGLTIARTLVNLHGGSIRVESAGAGQGSDFIIELPASTLREAALEPEAAPRASVAQPQGPRILVVDDNTDAADLLTQALQHIGYDVAAAHDGPSALERARDFRPDVALLDIGLPVMDGYELAERLQTDETGNPPPTLIAVTGYGQDADRRRATAAGFAHHLVKPIDIQELMGLLDRVLAED